ncbi:MAG: hypothetical protein Q7K43_02215 [Candidatus Woesearchaeota archaeon]|nr:hypothetical protein [Candidatus Woesearchaeota archaeon]
MPDQFQSFNDSVRLAELFLNRGQLALAKDQYNQLLLTYNQLMLTTGDPNKKAEAHAALTRIYTALSSSDPISTIRQTQPTTGFRQQASSGVGLTATKKESTPGPSIQIYATIILLLAFSIAVFIKPEFLGMATFEGTPKITEYVSLHFEESGIKTLTLKHAPSGIGISGKITKTNEQGSAKIYIEHNGNKLLFDSTQTSLVNGVFQNQCIECALPGYSSKDIKFVVELHNASLDLESVSYTVEEKYNKEPEWIGKEKTLKINSKTVIDLNKNFKDTDGDELVFLVSDTGNELDTKLNLNTLTLTPQKKGSYQLTLIASDLLKVTKVPIIVEVY